MWPAGIEPAAPRVSDERSTGELRPRDGRGWTRTSDNLFVRQALSPLSYSPVRIRDKGSNLDLHVQSVVSCRLDDPGSCLSVQLPVGGRRNGTAPLFSSGARHACRASYVHATRLPFDPGSPAASVHVRGTTSSWRGFGARVSYTRRNPQAKADANVEAQFWHRAQEQSFSLRRGLDSF